jgi:serine/threonine-protein kinase
MILSYCLNPNCPQPKNEPNAKVCKTCGTPLILHNRYRAIKKIGKGGFGATFLAIDLSLPGNPFCVIKQLRCSTNNPEAFQMGLDLFKREAKTLGKIDHPQIPRLLDYFEDSHQFYLVQSLVKGRNLQQEVKQNGIFSEMAVKYFLAELLPVLQYIHSLKIIHRDIKPANIIRRQQDGHLVLIDFGAVKDQVNTQLIKTYGQTALTQFGVGTLGYAPPEQLAMRPVYASDLYALAATCLYLLIGKSPKDLPCNPTTGKLLWEQELKVSVNFAQILKKMLEIDLVNRYQSAEEVINALDIIPYEQELKESLISYLDGSERSVAKKLELDSQATHYTSATIRLAMAIRARKSRQGKNKFLTELSAYTIPIAYANGRKDFSQQNFNALNLARANLVEANFRYSQLIRANLEEADLSKTNFYSANLSEANLRKANLQQAYLFKTKLQKADLREANLQGANLLNANLKGADLREANLQGANLLNANLKGANLAGADLSNTQVHEGQLEEAKTNWATIFPEGKRRLW